MRLDSDGSGCGQNKAIKQERRREVRRNRNERNETQPEHIGRSARCGQEQCESSSAKGKQHAENCLVCFEKGVLNISGGAYIFVMYFWRPEKWHDRNNELMEGYFCPWRNRCNLIIGCDADMYANTLMKRCLCRQFTRAVVRSDCMIGTYRSDVARGWMSKTSSIIWSTKRHRRARQSPL